MMQMDYFFSPEFPRMSDAGTRPRRTLRKGARGYLLTGAEPQSGVYSLPQARKNCGAKKSKVQKLGRAGECRSTPSAENPSGVDKRSPKP
jgi:hypothetical protein